MLYDTCDNRRLQLYCSSCKCKIEYCSDVVRTPIKLYAHQRETTGSGSDSLQLRPFSKWKLLLKERTCSQRERILFFKSNSLSILLKLPFALKNSKTVYLTRFFSTQSYSDMAIIDNFDLIFFYFYFVFEIFGNNSILTP